MRAVARGYLDCFDTQKFTSGGAHLLFRQRNARSQAIDSGARQIQRLHSLHAGSLQFLRAPQLSLGIFEVYLQVCDGRSCCIAVGFRGLEPRAGIRIVERGEHLSVLYVHTSSAKIAVTLPVILAATVARRRSVT